MILCDTHWDELEMELRERGLGRFMPCGNDFVTEAEFEEYMRTPCFKPVFGAVQAIFRNSAGFIASIGDGTPNEDDCVICWMIKHCTCGGKDDCNFRAIVAFAANGQLAVAREQGLVASA